MERVPPFLLGFQKHRVVMEQTQNLNEWVGMPGFFGTLRASIGDPPVAATPSNRPNLLHASPKTRGV